MTNAHSEPEDGRLPEAQHDLTLIYNTQDQCFYPD